jgi:hypothetical protein
MPDTKACITERFIAHQLPCGATLSAPQPTGDAIVLGLASSDELQQFSLTYPQTVQFSSCPPDTSTKSTVRIYSDCTKLTIPLEEWNWEFDESAGLDAIDFGTHALPGLLHGMPSPVRTSESAGHQMSGRALYFDGEDDYVAFGELSSAESLNLPLDGITVSMWVRPEQYRNFAAMLSFAQQNGVEEGGWYVGTMAQNNRFTFALRGEKSENFIFQASQPHEQSTWYSVDATYDGRQQKLTVDGATEAITTNDGGRIQYCDTYFAAGAYKCARFILIYISIELLFLFLYLNTQYVCVCFRDNTDTYFFNGWIDTIRIFRDPFNSFQLEAMHKGLSNIPMLVAEWKESATCLTPVQVDLEEGSYIIGVTLPPQTGGDIVNRLTCTNTSSSTAVDPNAGVSQCFCLYTTPLERGSIAAKERCDERTYVDAHPGWFMLARTSCSLSMCLLTIVCRYHLF